MNVSKDILRHLIENYFHPTEVYQCQFVSKFTRSCITLQQLYKSRCNIITINMHKKQNEYFRKRRINDINNLVNEKLKNQKGRKTTRKKLLKLKYSKQEGDTRCNFCTYTATPNEISLHTIKHADYHYYEIINCETCGCLNPDEKESPHFKEGCPLTEYYCVNCRISAPGKFLEQHCECKTNESYKICSCIYKSKYQGIDI